jgi:hypothetical protein
MKLTPLLLLIPCLLAGTAMAGFRPVVTAVGANSITVKTSEKAGLKVTDIDSDGTRTAQAPSNIVTYQVPFGAQIVVDGLPSQLSDVHPGMTVVVTQGMDRDTAESIVASTVPPAAKPTATPLNWKPEATIGRRPRSHAISGNVVLAISPERITYGQLGTTEAKASFITPATSITINGQPSASSAITVGMSVEVTTTDGARADEITATDVDK